MKASIKLLGIGEIEVEAYRRKYVRVFAGTLGCKPTFQEIEIDAARLPDGREIGLVSGVWIWM